MLPETVAPEKTTTAASVAEAQNLLEGPYRSEYRTASLEHLEIHPDGTVGVDGERIPCTRSFLEACAKAIGMPIRYAYTLDFGLFKQNFDGMKGPTTSRIKVCITGGRAVGITKSAYRPARSTDILHGLPPEDGQWQIRNLHLSDYGLDIDMVSPLDKIEPQPGDEIETGVRISNSETGFRGLKASLFTYRLICSNGAVMADELGTVRWNYDQRVTYDASVAHFRQKLAELLEQRQQAVALYESVATRPLMDDDFVKLWRRLRRELDAEHVDDVLDIDPAVRRRIEATVRARANDTATAETTPWGVYEIHNRITYRARGYSFPIRRRLEQLGGELLYVTNRN